MTWGPKASHPLPHVWELKLYAPITQHSPFTDVTSKLSCIISSNVCTMSTSSCNQISNQKEQSCDCIVSSHTHHLVIGCQPNEIPCYYLQLIRINVVACCCLLSSLWLRDKKCDGSFHNHWLYKCTQRL